jgi:peptidyl-prolyl cis-trans isomerase D
MFDFIQKRKRLMQILLAVLVIPFAFFGLEAYTSATGAGDAVAKVDGMSVSEREFSEEWKQQQERMRSMFGRSFDPAVLDTPEARRALLDGLIARRLVAAAIAKANIVISDDALREAIAAIPAFQSGGKFSHDSYEALLRNQGMTPATFESQMRHDLAVGMLGRAFAMTAIVPGSLAARLVALEGQKYEIAEALIPAQRFLGEVSLDETKLRAYYDGNAGEFRTAERIKAEYLVLSGEEIARQVQPSESELRAAYEQRGAQMKVDEQRRASHILLQVSPSAPEAERKAARAKLEEVAAQLKKNPAAFAELARKLSQDTGSASKGGDLGFFGRGMMAKPFEEATFALKEGETSAVVETEFGYHLIRVTGIRAASARRFEDARAELLAEIRQKQAAQKFAEAAEVFSNMVYEQTSGLAPVAEKFGIKVQVSDWIGSDPASAPRLLANAKLLGALFATESIKSKRNTDAVEVAPGTLVAARVLEHQPAKTRPYEEVRAEIERKLRLREALKLAANRGGELLEQARKGGGAELAWSAPKQVTRMAPQELDAEALKKAVATPADRLPAYFGLQKGNEGYAVYRVSRITPPEPKPAAQAKVDVQRLAALYGSTQYEAFVASLRARADVKINEKVLQKRETR